MHSFRSVGQVIVIEFPCANGFGEVSIHPRLQAALPIAFHGMGGKGHDGRVNARMIFVFANLSGCFEPIHFGHLHVHQHHIIGLRFERFHCQQTILNNFCGVTPFFEQAPNEPLIYRVVFSD